MSLWLQRGSKAVESLILKHTLARKLKSSSIAWKPGVKPALCASWAACKAQDFDPSLMLQAEGSCNNKQSLGNWQMVGSEKVSTAWASKMWRLAWIQSQLGILTEQKQRKGKRRREKRQHTPSPNSHEQLTPQWGCHQSGLQLQHFTISYHSKGRRGKYWSIFQQNLVTATKSPQSTPNSCTGTGITANWNLLSTG